MARFNNSYARYLVRCVACGRNTNKTFAAANGGKCKACATGVERVDTRTEHRRKHGRCEDAPCCGCCGPQGDGDYYGYAAMEAAMEPRW
jgi:hypothetical protein